MSRIAEIRQRAAMQIPPTATHPVGPHPCPCQCCHAVRDRRELLALLERARPLAEQFANWRTPSAADWNNGAVRDEFRKMQDKARALLSDMGSTTGGE